MCVGKTLCENEVLLLEPGGFVGTGSNVWDRMESESSGCDCDKKFNVSMGPNTSSA